MTKQERAVRTRHALIASAATAFERCGYAEATLNMISAGAGVSPGALHFHFENKAALGAAVEHAALRALRTITADAHTGRTPALQTLTGSSHALMRMLLFDPVLRAGFRLGREAAYTHASSDLREEWQRHVALLIARAAAEDTLLPDLCEGHATAMVVAGTTGFEVLGRSDHAWASHAPVTGFWRLMLPCLATPEALRTLDPAGGIPPAPQDRTPP
ncbi:ScbR family autoregulator-binding transcription factor [Streptomyces sp. NPDC002911]